MSGKINGISSGSAPQPVGAGNAGQSTRNMSGAGASAAGATTDSVAITDTASVVATAEQGLSAIPVVNESRVNTIRSAIEAGTYKIQPQKIASKLLEFERDFPEASAADSSDLAESA